MPTINSPLLQTYTYIHTHNKKLTTITLQPKAINSRHIKAPNRRTRTREPNRNRTIRILPIQAFPTSHHHQTLSSEHGAARGADGRIIKRDNVGVLDVVLDVVEPGAAAVGAAGGFEHADADGGGGGAERNLRADPRGGVGACREGVAVGDGGGVGGDGAGGVDAAFFGVGYGGEGGGDGGGGEECREEGGGVHGWSSRFGVWFGGWGEDEEDEDDGGKDEGRCCV